MDYSDSFDYEKNSFTLYSRSGWEAGILCIAIVPLRFKLDVR